MHKTEKKKRLTELLEKISKVLPQLESQIEQDGLVLDANSNRVVVPWDDILAESETKERRWMQTSGRTFIDLSSGMIHVSHPGMFIHTKIPTSKRRLSAHQCALLAVLCEMEGDLPHQLLNGPLAKLQRHLESTIGAPLQQMALSRLRTAIHESLTGSSKVQKGEVIDFSRKSAIDAIGNSFTLKSIGHKRTFAIGSNEEIEAIIDDLYPGCIEGISSSVHESGAFVTQRDLVCSREMELEIGQTLGPEVGPRYRGETILLRTASRVSVAVLAGKYERKFLNPILAAAAAMNTKGMLGEIGRDLWQTLHQSL